MNFIRSCTKFFKVFLQRKEKKDVPINVQRKFLARLGKIRLRLSKVTLS